MRQDYIDVKNIYIICGKTVQKVAYTVERKAKDKKHNDFLADGLEAEVIHHHPEDTTCDCCQQAITETRSNTFIPEEAIFILATIWRVSKMYCTSWAIIHG